MHVRLLIVVGAALLCGRADSRAGAGSAPERQSRARPSIRFEEVVRSGVSYSGMSYGAAWGDVDGDGRPDLFLGNHYDRRGVSLYRNLGGGVFRDVGRAWSLKAPRFDRADRHAGLFADFDNDGDRDLLVATGADFGTGAEPSLFFLNEGERFRECAEAVALDYPLAPARGFVPIDLDRDGALDVLCMARKRADGTPMTAFFRQTSTAPLSFAELDTGRALAEVDGEYGQVIHLGGRGLVLFSHGWPPAVLGTGAGALQDLTSALGLPELRNVADSAWADFDGDGDLDFFGCTSRGASDFALLDARTVHARLMAYRKSRGLRVAVADDTARLKVHLYRPVEQLPLSAIFLGADRRHPEDYEFELDASDASAQGLAEVDDGQSGVCIGFDKASRAWTLLIHPDRLSSTQVILRSTVDVVDVEPIGFRRHADAMPDVLLTWDGERFHDRSEAAGFVHPTNATSVAAADFDNDMDVDLFVVTRSGARNTPDVVYENLGGGVFEPVAGSANAAGTEVGAGDCVATADFDGDGFLDLCVTNGEGFKPFFGPVQLFRNAGNKNHWLMIDLVGNRSNRDGLGARVRVTAGGVTQLRLQDGGVHRFGQNHARLHFGMGEHTAADRIAVDWPSGATQELTGVALDRVLRIVEPE